MQNRLRELRENELKLSRASFAEKIDVQGNYIYMIENGFKPLNDKIITRICKEFSVNEKWLRDGTGDIFAPLSHSQEVGRMSAELLKMPQGSARYRLAKRVIFIRDDKLDYFISELKKLIDE